MSCATKVITPSETIQRPAAKQLTEAEARRRSSLVSDVKYALQIDLTQKDFFAGKNKISFQLKKIADLSLDFTDGKIQELLINGRRLSAVEYNNYYIKIPSSSMVLGENTIEVHYTHAYNSSGSGLYRFQDPVDQKVYVYSDFEPYDANLFFPCFDQPDLKATYTTQVLAPSDWTVISTTKEIAVHKEGPVSHWSFPESLPLSTYVFSLHAGPYKIWTDQAKTASQTIPLRLMARQSLAQYVNPEEWFSTTRQGFAFFETFFGYPYPYKKYDQIAVPDFNSGAMENVGAVTFNERTISRGQKMRIEKMMLANVILHEMAHMWFGDLVTMQWWNDIWLNESFATYASFLALSKATPYKDAWTAFYNQKRGAYNQDQQITTHPITFTVPNTDVVFANFDGLTYGKGASVLKQLSFYLGEPSFQKGLQSYFKDNAFKNTTLADFMKAMNEASGKDLSGWQKEWLEIPQVNTVQVRFDCDKDKIKNAQLLQSAVPEFPTLRTHKTRVGAFQWAANSLQPLKQNDLIYQGSSTEIPFLNGLSCKKVALIYPNVDDQDYAKFDIDPLTLKTMKSRLSSIKDDTVRTSLWGAAWDMVRDQKMSATEYINLVFAHTAKEKNTDILPSVLGRASFSIFSIYPQQGPGSEQGEKLKKQWLDFTLKTAKISTSPDLQKIWFDNYVNTAYASQDLQNLKDYLQKKPKWLRFTIDQERRWNLISRLQMFSVEGANEILDAEKKKDLSERGENAVLYAQALRPDTQSKRQFWSQILKGPSDKQPLGKLNPLIYGLFPTEQKQLQRQFQDEFFLAINAVKEKPIEFVRAFLDMTPTFCEAASVQKIKMFEKTQKNLPPLISKSLRSSAQDDERCVKMRQMVIQNIQAEPKHLDKGQG